MMKGIAISLLAGLLAVWGFVYSGSYNIGADEPHWPLTFKLLEAVRDRSIERHASGIQVPDLTDPKLIAEGAEHYAAMCSGCHLAPGMKETEIRAGLYPQPPNLASHEHEGSHDDGEWSAAQKFWVIKHGIKTTAMPAWGATHDDQSIWGLVAFLQKFPDMSVEQYRELTSDEHEHHHHHHDE